MKLYYFNPNDYNFEFFTIGENKYKALEYLINHLSKFENDFVEELEVWKNVNPMDITTLPKGYTIDEYQVGDVIVSEIA